MKEKMEVYERMRTKERVLNLEEKVRKKIYIEEIYIIYVHCVYMEKKIYIYISVNIVSDRYLSYFKIMFTTSHTNRGQE